MAKPTQTTEWASDASYVEPTSGKKAVGFEPEEKPPAQYLDWLFYTLELWIAWLNGIVAPASGSESVSMSSAGNILADGKHGPRKFPLHPLDFKPILGSAANFVIDGTSIEFVSASEIRTAAIPLNFLKVGDRIREALIYVIAETGSGQTLSLVRTDRTTGGTTTIASNNSLQAGEEVMAAVDHTVLEDNAYFILLTVDASASSLEVTYVEVTVDRP